VHLEEQFKEPAGVPWAQLRIPSFPQVSIRVLQLASNETAPMRAMSDLISSDPAFSSEVLTIANSPLYAHRLPVNTVMQAIALLGTRTLKGVCLTVGVRSYLGKSFHHEALRAIWRHSLATALIADQISSADPRNKNSAYTAGILHDIGRLGLAVLHPKGYGELLQTHVGSAVSILQCERELFGFDHCEAGRHLVADWNLPSELEPIVSQHHTPRQDCNRWQLVDLIGVSCRMADSAGFAGFPGCEITAYSELLEQLPVRQRQAFFPNAEELAFDIGRKINALECL
jgi:HD-like signal output (HDOD) protein